MITYLRCNEVSMEHIFQAFSLGFSDYSIRLTMEQDDFAHVFSVQRVIHGATLSLPWMKISQLA